MELLSLCYGVYVQSEDYSTAPQGPSSQATSQDRLITLAVQIWRVAAQVDLAPGDLKDRFYQLHFTTFVYLLLSGTAKAEVPLL